MQNQILAKKQVQMLTAVKRADVVLIIGCLLTAMLMGIFFLLHHEKGSAVRISWDGNTIAVVTLKPSAMDANGRFYLIRYHETGAEIESFDEKPVLTEAEPFNLLYVEDGRVSMTEADCRDQICVEHRPIAVEGESIICLPNRLVLEITGNATEGHSATEALDGHQMESPDERSDESLDGVVE